MSAELWECGHAFHLFEISSVRKSPFIHLHFLSDEDAGKIDGFEMLEICCHACGTSKLLYYPVKGPIKESRRIRDSFIKTHASCKRAFRDPSYCPNYRSKFEIVDLRNAKTLRALQKPVFLGNKETDLVT